MADEAKPPRRFIALGTGVPADLLGRLQRRADLLGVPFHDYIRWVLSRAAPTDLDAPVTLDMKEDWTPPPGGAAAIVAESKQEIREEEERMKGEELAPRKKRRRPWDLAP